MAEPRVVILGGGPAGLGAAAMLRTTRKAQVVLVEQNAHVGGNAGSFELNGQRVDFGSHRLHPSCDARILADIRDMLGNDLLDRPRHGRIHLRNRWIHFPLKPVDLLLHLDPRFALGTLRDMVHRPSYPNGGGDSFASVLWRGLGPTICRDFYFPYARKMWGLEPEELSAIQARKRVGASSFGRLAKRVLSQVPGLKPAGAGRYFYPRQGYGQISDAYAKKARTDGAELMLGWRVAGLSRGTDDAHAWRVTVQRQDETRELNADYVWSTIPASLLPRLVTPPPAAEVLDATRSLESRAMLLIYLTLDEERFSEYDAHYFPGADIAITRMSEPKNYSLTQEPRGRTILCAELPCSTRDAYWTMSDAELGDVVRSDLATARIPLRRPPVQVTVRRLPHAYPVYRSGYERPFALIDDWVESVPRLLSFGRQGLFAHDNTHHALYMAYAATDCLRDGAFDWNRWLEYRQEFASHVVED